ncbi:MAG TPA: non-ribosomal peptide synthetase [Streptomyces sp.]|nr:non-ribosomal peptide synthetase [Streptomyces sp.]
MPDAAPRRICAGRHYIGERMRTNLLAYAIYTSGSTGRPKGALVEHGGAVNHLAVKCAELDIQASDRIAFTAPVAFDISVWQMLAALGVGATTSVFSRAEAADPQRLAELVAEREITILEVVPSMLREILHSPFVSRENLRSLRCMLSTGESLPVQLAREWKDRYPDIQLVNAYGPTECSDDVAHYVVPADHIPNPVPVGKPIENSCLYILDADLELAPQGLRGQLYVGGLAVGRGYYNDPRRTAKAFIPDPFSQRPGARMYHTGDVVRWVEDGTLTFEGRNDSQVKIRGNRIELGELQSHFAAEQEVADVFVTTTQVGRDEDQEIVAFVVPGESAPADEDELSGRLLKQLRLRVPSYMLPARIHFLGRLPLSPAGKVDRNALLRELKAAPVAAPSAAVELTAAERDIRAIWAEVLDAPAESLPVGRSFFECGGNSLSALRLLSHFSRDLNFELSLQVLFAEPTIKDIALRLDQYRAQEEEELRTLLAMVESLPEDELGRIIGENGAGA